MKTLIVALLFLVNSPAIGIDKPVDGIYMLSQDDTGLVIKGKDGSELHIGGRVNLEIRNMELYSLNNENTEFRLKVTIPYDEGPDILSFILIVDGKAYLQDSSGGSGNTLRFFGFAISREDNAKRISEHMRTPLLYCHRTDLN